MEETMNTDEPSDPVREPIKGRTIILGDWFTYRGKRYKVIKIDATMGVNENYDKVPYLYVYMSAVR